jgi:hypothetical protein
MYTNQLQFQHHYYVWSVSFAGTIPLLQYMGNTDNVQCTKAPEDARKMLSNEYLDSEI